MGFVHVNGRRWGFGPSAWASTKDKGLVLPGDDCGVCSVKDDSSEAIVPTITEWVVDRLMQEHQQFVRAQDEALRGHAMQLALASLGGRQQTRACFQAWLAQGMALDTLYLQVLAPAANLVGQWWQDDSVDFAHSTLGYNHLQDLLVEFSPQFLAQSSGYAAPASHRALMMGQPHAQHALGLMMLAEFFRRDGWSVTSASKMGRFEALSTVGNEAFDLIAVSVSTTREFSSLKKLIAQLRERSLNPRVVIMVGGPVLALMPDLAEQLGADFSSTSADQALRDAAQQVRLRQKCHAPQPLAQGHSHG